MNTSLAALLSEARIHVKQTVEGVALLLNIPAEEYDSYENGVIPTESILKEICSLFEWNFLEISRLILTQSSQSSLSGITSKNFGEENAPEFRDPTRILSGERFTDIFRRGIEQSGTTLEALALLLSLDLQTILDLNNGLLIPSDELLRVLCSSFGWNYNELYEIVRRESQSEIPFVEKKISTQLSTGVREIQSLCEQIGKKADDQPDSALQVFQVQLELILESMSRMKLS